MDKRMGTRQRRGQGHDGAMSGRKAGARLRRRARQHQWHELRDRGHRAWLAVASYPLIVVGALAAMALSSLALGTWPPSVMSSAFQRGILVGATIIGAAWWVREMAEILAAGAERDRKGANGEEFTASVLRPLLRHGWRVVHDIEYFGTGNVDHVLIGPGGVIAIDSKYTTEKLWVTPKAIGGSRSNFIGQAKYAAGLADRALQELGLGHLTVEPALAFWGPGAPTIEGGYITIQNTLVLDGPSAASWRGALLAREQVLDQQTTRHVAAQLKNFVPARHDSST